MWHHTSVYVHQVVFGFATLSAKLLSTQNTRKARPTPTHLHNYLTALQNSTRLHNTAAMCWTRPINFFCGHRGIIETTNCQGYQDWCNPVVEKGPKDKYCCCSGTCCYNKNIERTELMQTEDRAHRQWQQIVNKTPAAYAAYQNNITKLQAQLDLIRADHSNCEAERTERF